MHEVMTPEEVAAYLRLSREAVYRLIRARKLAASKIGRSYRIPREDLTAFLIANSTRPEVRDALFRRVMEAAEANPGVNSDDVLAELEQEDRERNRRAVG